ncbi:phenylalanine ammonia-lyase [Polyplosphaeria fusca]|uniref:Phenylalanine ammonia-lyase n=1 Tax=Polyplosphaeria fusca TaxID=682080 RepID=A0A9P4QLD3_9PLEO|nr:phenylalanine ammonia-lyase [Polyplosphaeria fusca]
MESAQGVMKSNELESRAAPHLHQTLRTWSQINALIEIGEVEADGNSLNLASVVAVGRHGCVLTFDKSVLARAEQSIQVLQDYLSNGSFLYGVNTGFGGSADTRTEDLLGLQRALMQLVQSAILTKEDKSESPNSNEYLDSHSMPSVWVRATVLIRCNANVRGHSGMTANVLNAMALLLKHDIVPVIPLRGSLSASGDIMPLSYIAGAIQGSPDIFVRTGRRSGTPKVKSAEQALNDAAIEPIVLGAKEGLSLINGTAAATAVATLGLYEAHQLAILSQVLTALTSEAIYANVEWTHPFIASVRPHSGQIEAAQNIRNFLHNSKLVYGLKQDKDRFKKGLIQERYALRSSPQWLSPQLEDLVHAERQLIVELNSTSDNPVINVAENDVHCGANFQAATVTTATEKVRLALQSIGRMLFSQTSEMINNDLSNGLPPNLAADDPSLSFCLKGVDVNTAAYTSELGFLANPVSNHVQSAEMHNQSINSLALISARQTFAAVEVLSMIVANCLYTGCQGVDLRTLHRTFLEGLKGPCKQLLSPHLNVNEPNMRAFDTFWESFELAWYASASLDAADRAAKASETLAAAFVAAPQTHNNLTVAEVSKLQRALSDLVLHSYLRHRDAFFRHPTTAEHLGKGTRVMYLFVRNKLGVPLHRGLVEHPVAGDPSGNMIDGRPKRSIGSWISIIYEAVRNGELCSELFRSLGEESMGKQSEVMNGQAQTSQ